jgi:hypothetical protein
MAMHTRPPNGVLLSVFFQVMKEFLKTYNQGWADVTWAAPTSVVVPPQPADALSCGACGMLVSLCALIADLLLGAGDRALLALQADLLGREMKWTEASMGFVRLSHLAVLADGEFKDGDCPVMHCW